MPRLTCVAYHSGLIKFRSEIALSLYSQISPFYRKTSLQQNGTRILTWNIPSGKIGLQFSDVLLLPEKSCSILFNRSFCELFHPRVGKKHGILIQLLDHFTKLLSCLLNLRRSFFELFTRKTVMNHWSI